MFRRRPQHEATAGERAVLALRAVSGDRLPEAYFAFLLDHWEGGAFRLPDGKRFVLWPPAEVLELNERFDVGDNYPRLFAVGSDGGQWMYALDLREAPPLVVTLPFIGVIEELQALAPDFAAFARQLAASGPARR